MWVQLGYNRYVAFPLLSRKVARGLHVAVETYCAAFSISGEEIHSI